MGRVLQRYRRAASVRISAFGNNHAVGVVAVEAAHARVRALPSYPTREREHPPSTSAVRRSTTFSMPTSPGASGLDAVAFAVVWRARAVHQANLQPGPVRQLHHRFQKLRASAGALRAVVRVDHQSLHVRPLRAHAAQPQLERVHPGVAGLLRAEDKYRLPILIRRDLSQELWSPLGLT